MPLRTIRDLKLERSVVVETCQGSFDEGISIPYANGSSRRDCVAGVLVSNRRETAVCPSIEWRYEGREEFFQCGFDTPASACFQQEGSDWLIDGRRVVGG